MSAAGSTSDHPHDLMARAGSQAVAEYVDHSAPVRPESDAATARASRLLTSDAAHQD